MRFQRHLPEKKPCAPDCSVAPKLQCVCVCAFGCVSVCTQTSTHSRPQDQRLEADVSATDLERRSWRAGGREPPGVCRILGVNELGAPGRKDRTPPPPPPQARVE